MDFIKMLESVFAVSPLAGVLLYFLRTVWLDQRKDRAESMAMMKEHNQTMFQMHEKSIMASKDSSDAIRQLGGSLGDFKEEIKDKIDELKPGKNGKIRSLPITPIQPAPAQA